MNFCRKFNLQIYFSDYSAIVLPGNVSPIRFTANEDIVLPPRDIGMITVRNINIESGQFFIYSFSRIIISDKGKEFCNQLLGRIHDTLGIAHHRSISYNPWENSVIGHNNRTVGDSLRHYLSIYENEWENMLSAIVFAINTSINESSRHTPFFLLFSWEHASLTDYMFKASKDTRVVNQLSLINTIRQTAKQNIEKVQAKSQDHDSSKFKPIEFKKGDLVLLDYRFLTRGRSKKFQPKYREPYRIVAKINDQEGTYKIQLANAKNENQKYEIVNLRHMKPYIMRTKKLPSKRSHLLEFWFTHKLLPGPAYQVINPLNELESPMNHQ